MYSSFKNYTNQDIINFLKKQGLEVKEERGNRIFPVTDKSMDVLRCFEKRLKELNVKIYFEETVKEIIVENDQVKGVILENTKTRGTIENNRQPIGIGENDGQTKGIETYRKQILADKVIIATGGKSYPLTGSTGDGYELAKKVGHTVTEIKPSLVPLTCFEKELCQEMQGLSLRNVAIFVEDLEKNKKIYNCYDHKILN